MKKINHSSMFGIRFVDGRSRILYPSTGIAPSDQGWCGGIPKSFEGSGRRDTKKRLAELKQKLNLKPTQLAAWETFSNALIAQAKAHAQSREKNARRV
ncbi:hypothetical protein ACFS07_34730 [Undibacterium arcticum]